VASWSLAGFYASLGPSLVGRVFELDASLLGGVALFVLASCGAATVLLLRHSAPGTMMARGALVLLAGVAITLVATTTHSVATFFIGTAISGAGFGAAFQGAVRSVVPFAQPHERAGVLSVIYVVSYLGMGLPAIVAGYLVAHGANFAAVTQAFGGIVMLLAATAAVGSARAK
jgi:MFS family permease